MKQVRIHGRGGQGVVTAAEILSIAAFLESRHAQAFPSFGSERMGAPVISFCRIDDREIQLREPIAQPDCVVVQDPTLLLVPGIFTGLADDGYAIINSAKPPEQLTLPAALRETIPPERLKCVAGTEIARKLIGRPLPNAAMLGALVGLTGWLKIESILNGIRQKFPAAIAEKNCAAALAAAEAIGAGNQATVALTGAGAKE